jgi:hypothetical protein
MQTRSQLRLGQGVGGFGCLALCLVSLLIAVPAFAAGRTIATSPTVRAPLNVPADLSGHMNAIEAVLQKHGLALGDTDDPAALQLNVGFDPNPWDMTVVITLTQPGTGVIASGDARNPGFGTVLLRGAVISGLVGSASKKLDKQLDGLNLALSQTPSAKDCFAALAEREDLKPLSEKVELVRTSETAPPFAIAANDTFPTESDRTLIAAWATGRDACLKEQFARFPNGSDGSLGATVYQQEVAFAQQSAGSVGELIVALYQRKLTFGEFSQKRYEITRDIAAADHQFRTAVMNADAERQMQARQIAQEALQNRLTAWATYMQSVQAREPLTVRLEGSVGVHTDCTSLAMGSLTTTNCH